MHFMYYHYHNDNATQNLKATMDKEKGMCKRPYSNHDDEYINILLQSFAQHVLLIADQDMEIWKKKKKTEKRLTSHIFGS